MALRIRTTSNVWAFTAAISIISVLSAELSIGIIYALADKHGFSLQNAIIMCAIIPALIAAPITYYVARTSLTLADTQADLKRSVDTDALTGLPNRRSFFRTAEQVLVGTQTPASLLVINADHFKELNDSYGHSAGDKALVAIADVLRSSCRHSDLIGRTGGKEFAILVPEMVIEDAQRLASRIVKRVAASPLSEPRAIIEYSVSCGVADTCETHDLQTLFKAADAAKDQTKRPGLNRVALDPIDEPRLAFQAGNR